MKVLNVINSLNIGGAERSLETVALETRFSSTLSMDICTLGSIGVIGERLRGEGIKVYCLGNNRFNVIAILSELFLQILKGKYDVVHAHLFPASYYVAFISKLLTKPVYVYTEHSLTNKRRVSFLRNFEKYIYNSYDGLISNSANSMSSLRNWAVPRKEIKILENGVRPPEVRKDSTEILNNNINLIFVGRLVYEKGADIAIESLRILRTKGINASLSIIGDGPERGKLEQISAGLPVFFYGYSMEPARLMAEHDILIVPSRLESLGLVAIEGMLVGIPVVASNSGALISVIDDQRTGLSVPNENAGAFANSIIKLVRDNSLRKIMVREAKKEAMNRWTIFQYLELLELYYYKLLNRKYKVDC